MTSPTASGRRPRGRPPRISSESIVAAVVEVGFAAASLPTVASHLNVSHSALYRHFPNRDALVRAASEAVLVGVGWPEPDAEWRPYLTAVGEGLFDVCTAHPGMAIELLRLADPPPTVTQLIGAMTESLLRSGVPGFEAVVVANGVFHTGIELHLGDLGLDEAMERRRAQTSRGNTMISETVRGPLAAALDRPPREWFTRKLDLLLAGAAATTRPNTAR